MPHMSRLRGVDSGVGIRRNELIELVALGVTPGAIGKR